MGEKLVNDQITRTSLSDVSQRKGEPLQLPHWHAEQDGFEAEGNRGRGPLPCLGQSLREGQRGIWDDGNIVNPWIA